MAGRRFGEKDPIPTTPDVHSGSAEGEEFAPFAEATYKLIGGDPPGVIAPATMGEPNDGNGTPSFALDTRANAGWTELSMGPFSDFTGQYTNKAPGKMPWEEEDRDASLGGGGGGGYGGAKLNAEGRP